MERLRKSWIFPVGQNLNVLDILFSLDHCDDLISPPSFLWSIPTPSESLVHICNKGLIQKGYTYPVQPPNLKARFVFISFWHFLLALFTFSNPFFHPTSPLSGCGKMPISRFLVLISPISCLSPSRRWFSKELGDGFLHTICVDMELSKTRKPKEHWVYQAAYPLSEARTIDSQGGSWISLQMGFSRSQWTPWNNMQIVSMCILMRLIQIINNLLSFLPIDYSLDLCIMT